MTSNIPIVSTDVIPLLNALKPKPLRPDQVNWPRNQRKIRKNRRRAHAAGKKNAFN